MVVAVAAAAVVVAVLAWLAYVFNRLVRDRNRCRHTWADVDALLVRRAQALPRLAAIVAGAYAHERKTLTAVAEARARVEAAGHAPTPERAAAEAQLGEAGMRLIALVEANPDLRAAESTRELIVTLRDVEGDLARGRMVYNRTVQSYEDRRRALPGALVAAPLGFGPQAYWQAQPGDRE